MPFEIDYSEYPILKQITYLDTPFEGLVPRSAWQKLNEHAMIQSDSFLEHDAEWRKEVRAEVTLELANMLHLKKEEIALVPGFSVGLREFIPWLTRFKKVILIEDDYPTLIDAFAVSGFEITMLARDEDGSFSIDDLAFALEENKGGVFAFCHVHNVSGLRVDLERIQALARANDVTTIMDVTQSFGTMELNIPATEIDCTVCSPYKWTGSGFGIGFVTVSEECRRLSGAIEQLNTGHLDPYATLRLSYGLKRLKAMGLARIQAHVNALADQLCAGLEQKGIRVFSNRTAATRSAIVQFEGTEALQKELMAKGVRTSFRGRGIRVGLHWYNTKEDVIKLLGSLE